MSNNSGNLSFDNRDIDNASYSNNICLPDSNSFKINLSLSSVHSDQNHNNNNNNFMNSFLSDQNSNDDNSHKSPIFHDRNSNNNYSNYSISPQKAFNFHPQVQHNLNHINSIKNGPNNEEDINKRIKKESILGKKHPRCNEEEKKTILTESQIKRKDHKKERIQSFVFTIFKQFIDDLLVERNLKLKKKYEKCHAEKLCDLSSGIKDCKMEDIWNKSFKEIYELNEISSKFKKKESKENNTSIIKMIEDKKNNNDKLIVEMRASFKLTFGEAVQIIADDKKRMSDKLQKKVQGSEILNYFKLIVLYDYIKNSYQNSDKNSIDRYIYNEKSGMEVVLLDLINSYENQEQKK